MMGPHLVKHGDSVKDISFAVEDLDTIIKVSMENFPRFKKLRFEVLVCETTRS